MVQIRVSAALLVGSFALLDCTPVEQRPEPVLWPVIKTVEIVPSYVSVMTGTRLVLEAKIRDASGTEQMDPRGDSVTWQVTQAPTVAPAPGRTAVIIASVTAPSTMTVVALLNGVSGTATINVSPGPPPATTGTDTQTTGTATPPVSANDWLRAPPLVSAALNKPEWTTFALVGNLSAGSQRTDSLFAFTESTEVGDFDCNGAMCGEITVFAPMFGIKRDTVRWARGCDFADFIGGATRPTGCVSAHTFHPLFPIPQRIRVPVVIWQASNSPDADAKIAADTAYALEAFDDPWTGFQLDFTVYIAAEATRYLEPYGSCQNPDPAFDITSQLTGIPAEEVKPDRITVAYVDEIDIMSALACPYDVNEGALILISNSGAGGSDLAHEIGHALGQWNDRATTHTDKFPGFDESNLMWSTETAEQRGIRKHLTLGQLFQMNLRDSSFVKQSKISPGSGMACPLPPGNDAPCPRLGRDASR